MRGWARSERCSFSRDQKIPGSSPASVFSERSENYICAGGREAKDAASRGIKRSPDHHPHQFFPSEARIIYARVGEKRKMQLLAGSKDPRIITRISFFRAKRELYMRGW